MEINLKKNVKGNKNSGERKMQLSIIGSNTCMLKEVKTRRICNCRYKFCFVEKLIDKALSNFPFFSFFFSIIQN